MRILTVLLCVAAMLQTSAQQKKPQPKFQYNTIAQVGLLTGSSTESAALQLIGGVKRNRLFTGIGTGVDYYMYRGIPVFADVRYDLLQKKGTLFAYADGGVHFPWVKGDTKDDWVKYYPGLYSDAGFGYQFKTKTTTSFLLSVGYSYKHVKQKYENLIWVDPWPVIPRPASFGETRNFYLHRLSVKLGIQF
ncbi:MAG: hypothetical protein K2X48_16170 [Chitinophagaceae bacterium]|nr:hypothetical protein [Chitinophagaceae bacterium]